MANLLDTGRCIPRHRRRARRAAGRSSALPAGTYAVRARPAGRRIVLPRVSSDSRNTAIGYVPANVIRDVCDYGVRSAGRRSTGAGTTRKRQMHAVTRSANGIKAVTRPAGGHHVARRSVSQPETCSCIVSSEAGRQTDRLAAWPKCSGIARRAISPAWSTWFASSRAEALRYRYRRTLVGGRSTGIATSRATRTWYRPAAPKRNSAKAGSVPAGRQTDRLAA